MEKKEAQEKRTQIVVVCLFVSFFLSFFGSFFLLFVFLFFLRLFVCLFVCSFVRLFVCLFVGSFVCLFVRLFVRLFVNKFGVPRCSRVLDDDKKFLLDDLPCFEKLRDTIVFPCLDHTTDLALAAVRRDQTKIPELVVAPVQTDGGLTMMLVNVREPMDRLANHAPKTAQNGPRI